MSRTYLSACLCFKNAAAYLSEWLAFYSILGVEHFYLYNNESADDFAAAIAPYLGQGKATVTNFPGRGMQNAIYAHGLATYGACTRWMMFCDDDEFLFPVADVPLPEALAKFEPFAGVATAWMLYGASGHRNRPAGLVIENYTRRMAYPDRHVKCIVDPSRVTGPINIGHEFRCVEGQSVVDENGQPLMGSLHPYPTAQILRVNHYLTKSIEEMTERRSRIQADTGRVSTLPLSEWIRLEATWSTVEDPLAARYAPRVRAAMAR